MLENIVRIDYGAQKVFLQGGKGAILLFDFATAFPSVLHEFCGKRWKLFFLD